MRPKRKRQAYKKPSSNLPELTKSAKPVLEDFGLAVFRSIEIHQFDEAYDQMYRHLGHLILYDRFNPNQKQTAISLVGISEARNQPPIGQIAVQEAIDHIYQSVPTLRQTVKAKPIRIGFIGRANSSQSSCAAFFDEESNDVFLKEREEVKSALEEIGEATLEFNWYKRWRPHVSLARLPLRSVQDIPAGTSYDVSLALPDSLRVSRATLHNPVPDWAQEQYKNGRN